MTALPIHFKNTTIVALGLFLVRHHFVSSISLRKIMRVKVQTESFLAVLQNWVSLARFLLCRGLWWEHIPSVVVFCYLYIRYGLFRHPVNTTCNPLLFILISTYMIILFTNMSRLTSSSLQGYWLYNIYKPCPGLVHMIIKVANFQLKVKECEIIFQF